MGKYEKRRTLSEEAELEQAFTNLTGGRKPAKSKQKKRKKRTPILVCAGIAVLLLLGLVLCLLLPRGQARLGRFTLAGVDLTGMTREEAENALSEAATRYVSKDLILTLPGGEIHVSPAVSALAPDMAGAVDAAFTYGTSGFDLLPYLHPDINAIRQLLETEAAGLERDAIPSSFDILGEKPEAIEPGAPGQTLRLYKGMPGCRFDPDVLLAAVLDAYREGRFSATAEGTETEPAPLDLSAVFESYFTAPVDAEVDKESYAVIPEQWGYGFDLPAALAALAAAEPGGTVDIPFAPIPPAVTAEALNAGMYQDVLASYRTPHTDDADRNVNLRLACAAINGYVIKPGEEFSYNAVLGERTAAKGYRPADSYVNGLTVKTLGGGICQVSSTLYYCTLTADLQTVERYAHSYVPEYMPKGTDAAVSWGTKDFRFRNSSHHPIRIEAWMEGGYVYVRLLGTEEKDYDIELEYEQLSASSATTVYQEYPPDNPYGYKDGQVLVTPYDGCTVKTYQYLYDKQTKELVKTVLVDSSRYRVRNEVICKIVVPPPPTEPPTVPTEPTTVPTVPPSETAPPTIPPAAENGT